jgi:putative Mn2+ efflux pump MntP
LTSPPVEAAQQRTRQLLVTGIALSIDNLTIGFARGTYHVNLALAAITIGTVSVTLPLTGLELGDGSARRPASGANSSAASYPPA